MKAPNSVVGRPVRGANRAQVDFWAVRFTDVSMKLYRSWIPEFVRRWLLRALVFLMHARMTDLGFKPLTKRTHPTSNATIVQHIAYNRVIGDGYQDQ